MRLSCIALAAALAGIVGCGRPDVSEPPGREPGASPAKSPSSPQPRSAEPPRYVGRWAAKDELCTDGAWTFEARKLSTAGEVACEFREVSAKPFGYEIDALCWAQAPPERHRLTLRFAESARAMLVEGGPFADMGLVRCEASTP